MRRAGAFLMTGVIVLGLLAFLPGRARAAASADVAQFLADTNRERAAQGAGPLSLNDALSGVAQAWAHQMADASHLAHNPDLVSQIDRNVTTNWSKYGENVGTGPDVESIQAAFVRSPEHHQNIIDPAFTQVGIAVSYAANGALWVALDFLHPVAPRQVSTAGASPSSPPANAAAPAPARPAAVAVLATAPAATAQPVAVALAPPASTPPAPAPVEASPTITPTLDIAQLASGLNLPAPFVPHGPGRLRLLIEIADAVLLAGVIGCVGPVRRRLGTLSPE